MALPRHGACFFKINEASSLHFFPSLAIVHHISFSGTDGSSPEVGTNEGAWPRGGWVSPPPPHPATPHPLPAQYITSLAPVLPPCLKTSFRLHIACNTRITTEQRHTDPASHAAPRRTSGQGRSSLGRVRARAPQRLQLNVTETLSYSLSKTAARM